MPFKDFDQISKEQVLYKDLAQPVDGVRRHRIEHHAGADNFVAALEKHITLPSRPSHLRSRPFDS